MSNALRADHLVAQHRRVGVGLVDDRLHVGSRGDTEVLRHPRRTADPRDVAVAHHQLGDRVAPTGVDTLDHRDVADHGVGDAMRVPGDHEVDGRVLQRPR